MLQKTFTIDFLTKKKKANEGEAPQYYVGNSHPAIIAPEVYDLVQLEIKKRKGVKGYKTGGSCFSGKIICSLLENRDEILQGYEAIIQVLTDTSKLDKESAMLQSEREVMAEMLRKCVEENANYALDQVEY